MIKQDLISNGQQIGIHLSTNFFSFIWTNFDNSFDCFDSRFEGFVKEFRQLWIYMNNKICVLQGAQVTSIDEWPENSNHYILNGVSENIKKYAIDVKRI